MAHYHFTVKSGERGSGADHAQYIQRSGRFKVERGYGEIGESEVGNLPAWAKGKAATFFARADDYERANGTAYREYELALPVELSEIERGQLVREFVKAGVGERRAYVWAIHEPKGHNPHVHVMFSDRQADGIERGAEQYFKRANPKNPERGGTPKFRQGESQAEVSAALVATRERWATMTNRALERAGEKVRVDHRSLEAQGIQHEAGEHRGPAVSGIEFRGKAEGIVAEVTLRRAAERVEREQAVQLERQALVAEIREVTREEVAAEKSAARERRDLLPETHGVVRAGLVAQVEADRREQIGRAAAHAERRIERRRSLPGRVGEKLLAQARALRDRVVELGGRVKEWVAERVAGPLQQIKDRTRDLLGTTLKRPGPGVAPGAVPLDLAALKAQGRAASAGWRQTLHYAQAEELRVERVRQAQEKERQLEAQRVERVRQAQAERLARERAESERTIERFRALAAGRAVKAYGYGDTSENWRATPAALRERIDRFNALELEMRGPVLEEMQRRPALVQNLKQSMDEREQLVKSLGRGMGR